MRPHEALDMKTPAEVYVKSKRKYKDNLGEINYPSNYQLRKVNQVGVIKLFDEKYFITTALKGYHVGLKTINNEEFEVYFSEYMLGIINVNTVSFKAV